MQIEPIPNQKQLKTEYFLTKLLFLFVFFAHNFTCTCDIVVKYLQKSRRSLYGKVQNVSNGYVNDTMLTESLVIFAPFQGTSQDHTIYLIILKGPSNKAVYKSFTYYKCKDPVFTFGARDLGTYLSKLSYLYQSCKTTKWHRNVGIGICV